MAQQPFNPDWCVAPARTLRDYMRERFIGTEDLVYRMPGLDAAEARAMISRVLDAQPYDAEVAAHLARATGVSADFWVKREADYRDGLARNLKDVT